jgi:hypothetical protein
MTLCKVAMTQELYQLLYVSRGLATGRYFKSVFFPNSVKKTPEKKKPSKQRFASSPSVAHFLKVVEKHENSKKIQKNFRLVKKKPTICNYSVIKKRSLRQEKLKFEISKGKSVF